MRLSQPIGVQFTKEMEMARTKKTIVKRNPGVKKSPKKTNA